MFFAVMADERSWFPLVLLVVLLGIVWLARRHQRKSIAAYERAVADSRLMQEQSLAAQKHAIEENRAMTQQTIDELRAIRTLLEKRT